MRLPDQFSPDALAATAATPTCCCCCCCCLATTLSAPIVLHSGMRNDLRESHAPESRRTAAPWWAAAVWPALLVVVFGPIGLSIDWDLLLAAVTLIGASVFTWAVASRAGAPRPYAAVARILLFAVLFGMEFVVGAYLLLSGVYLVVGPLLALVAVVFAIRAYR
ncbi:hypothetical protein [Alloactinosynnema sp. L-07]|nr:hypothetical protein [Alloactinosynnema sp. L-07]